MATRMEPIPNIAHKLGTRPPQHLLPSEETMPEGLEVHVWVGHNPSIEVDKVQAVKPAWERAQGEGQRMDRGGPAGWRPEI